MPPPDLAELKRRLRAEGFEIYRTRDGAIVLAERVRDNLIMDSGVAAQARDGVGSFAVVVTVKAQATHFPGASEQAVLDHARSLAAAFLERGYTAEEPRSRSVTDPGNPERTLDTAVEIPLSREVGSEDELFAELRVVLQAPRSSSDD